MEKQFFFSLGRNHHHWSTIEDPHELSLETPIFSLETPLFSLDTPYFRERPLDFHSRPDISAGDPQILVSLIKIWGSPKRRSWVSNETWSPMKKVLKWHSNDDDFFPDSHFFNNYFVPCERKTISCFFSCELVMMNCYIMAAFSFYPVACSKLGIRSVGNALIWFHQIIISVRLSANHNRIFRNNFYIINLIWVVGFKEK